VRGARDDAIEHNVSPEPENGIVYDGFPLSGASPGEYAALHGCSAIGNSSKRPLEHGHRA
jgi:hypothetical protein